MLLKPPENFLIRNIILDENFYKNTPIQIDDCIAEEIEKLWGLSIHTLGCCCGHGKVTGFIQVERTDFQKMLNLGYKWYREYPEELGGKNRFDAFIPKSNCECQGGKI